jgi:hypothetical protein
MPTQYGSNATKRLVNKPAEKIEAGEDGGRVRISYDSINSASAIPVADKVILGRLPKDARLLWVKIESDAAAGAADLGWEASADGSEAGDPDGVAAAQVLSADALVASPAKKFAAEVDISMTVTTEITAAATVSVSYAYALD